MYNSTYTHRKNTFINFIILLLFIHITINIRVPIPIYYVVYSIDIFHEIK